MSIPANATTKSTDPRNLRDSGGRRSAGVAAVAGTRQRDRPMALLARIAIIVFICEALMMVLLVIPFLQDVPDWIEALIDSTGLTLMAAPIIYFWLLRPAYRTAAKRTIELEQQKFALDAAAIVSVTDVQGRIIDANDKFCEISGFERAELLGQNHRILNSGVHPTEFFTAMYKTINRGAVWRAEVCNRMRNGGLVWMDATVIPSAGADGAIERYTAISFDITERKHMEDAIVAAQAAQRASRAKTEFLSSVSHELRTPLNAVLGLTNLLARDPSLGPVQAQRVRHIEGAGQHLLGMISDLLDLSVIERGGFRITPEAVALPELARDALLLAGAQWRDDIELRSTVTDDAALVVHADRLRLRQILVNLLSNGIKYNRKGGRVTLSAERRGSAIAISVTDTGRGLNAQQLAHLFEVFNRLGASNSSVQGAGIGLVISKKLSELMGGRIEVQSREGHGSTFTVWLPAAELAPATALTEVNGTQAMTRAAIANTQRAAAGAGNGAVFGAAGAMASLPHAEGDVGERKLVLYAEDNEINIVVISAMFELRPDLELRPARSGSEALKMARAQRPDLLLLDMHLGDMTGIELYAMLKHDPAMATLPVLALSADALPEQMAAARRAGIVRYLTKPVDCDVLLNNIDQALQEYQATQIPETSPFAATLGAR